MHGKKKLPSKKNATAVARLPIAARSVGGGTRATCDSGQLMSDGRVRCGKIDLARSAPARLETIFGIDSLKPNRFISWGEASS